MQTPKELSKEIAEFCRETAHQKTKRRVTQTGIGKAVLQGILVALLATTASSNSVDTSARSNPWQVGN